MPTEPERSRGDGRASLRGMRIAVSGSHGTGKSTLIAAFLERRPDYAHEPEAFELLGDDVEMDDQGPTAGGLRLLLAHTVAALERYADGARVVVERSPADYLAYAAASRWPRDERDAFVESALPLVRAGLARLDLVAYLPAVEDGRPDEDPRFRRRVDRALARALLDDEHDLFGGTARPRVVTLPAAAGPRLAELMRLADPHP